MTDVFISKAPTDPTEKKAWASQMARIQYAMWVDDGAKCAGCGRPYASTDDFIARNPLAGIGWTGKSETHDFSQAFVDPECADAYERHHPQWKRSL